MFTQLFFWLYVRADDLRSGQRVAVSLKGEIQRKVEGIYLFEEEEQGVIAVCFAAVRHVESLVPCSRTTQAGIEVQMFYVKVPMASLHKGAPIRWGEAFVGLPSEAKDLPKLSDMMKAYHADAAFVESEIETTAPPVRTTEPREDAAAAAGLNRRRATRLAALFETQEGEAELAGEEADELDIEDFVATSPRRPLREPGAGANAPRRPAENAALYRATRLLEDGADPNVVLTVEVLKFTREMRDEARRARHRDDYDSLSDSEVRPRTSLGKAVRGMAEHKRMLSEQLRRVINEFKETVKEELSVRGNQPWTYVDMHRTVSWGQYRSLQRVYILLMHIIQHLDDGKPLQAHALAIQAAKAAHLCAESSGNWKMAWGLTGLVDPCRRKSLPAP